MIARSSLSMSLLLKRHVQSRTTATIAHCRHTESASSPHRAIGLRSAAEPRSSPDHRLVPAGLGIFPFGIALGLLVMQSGLPWWVAPALSLSAFAGSLELLLVGMIATVEPLTAVAVTVFVVVGIALVVAPGVALFVAMLIFVGLLLVRYAIGRRHTGRSESA